MTNNGCRVCSGLGRILAFGLGEGPVCLPCPECAGLAITPASADDGPHFPADDLGAGVSEGNDGLPAETQGTESAA
ncbi:MAG TPA: hypothetical protein VNE62_12685 [Actinomycetota bacterium]|nr:hypothetical protein [Actinomycetota bacterium]